MGITVAREDGAIERRGVWATAASWSLLACVAVAFADSSVVVLALPELLRQFHLSITSVAWTVTSYNIALALTAWALARLASRGRLPATTVTRAGAGVFLAASLGCAASPDIALLVSARTVQGAAAACLLIGALPLLRSSAATPARGSALWVGAGILGAALGPAVGGSLTEIFSWRAIFLVQAPVAAAALAATFGRRDPERSTDATVVISRPRTVTLRTALALTFASAALVGLLFLAVLMLIDVWRFTPLAAAAVVSVIPLATAAVQPLAGRVERAATTGGVLLAGGLAILALLPARSVAWAIIGLTLAGVGSGVLLPKLTRDVLAGYGSAIEAGARTVWIRHAGLVLGLVILTPLLAADLSAAGTSAKLRGIAVVLDAPASAQTKLKLAFDLAPVLSRPVGQGMPNMTEALASEHDASLTAIGVKLDRVVQASVTRGFRRSFLVAALLALLTVAPGVAVRRRVLFSSRSRILVPVAAVAVACGVIAAELAAGAASFGEHPRLLPPCAARAEAAGKSRKQQEIFKAVDMLACQLHESREQFVANVAKSGPRKIASLLRGGTLNGLGTLGELLKGLLGPGG